MIQALSSSGFKAWIMQVIVRFWQQVVMNWLWGLRPSRFQQVFFPVGFLQASTFFIRLCIFLIYACSRLFVLGLSLNLQRFMLGFRFGLAVVFISLQVLYFLLWGLCLCPFGYLLGFTVMWGFRLCIFLLSWTVFCSLCYIFLPILPKPKAWKPASISLLFLSLYSCIIILCFLYYFFLKGLLMGNDDLNLLACIQFLCIFIFLWQLWIWLCIFLWYLGQILLWQLG